MNDMSGWFLFICMVLLFKDFGPPTDKHTVYLASCSQKSLSEGKCALTKTSPIMEFRALAESQNVVTLESGIAYRLRACTVMDSKNWDCSEPLSQGMSDGEYRAPWLTMTVRPISWLRWHAMRTQELAVVAPTWLLESGVASWSIGIATLIAALAAPALLYAGLKRRFPRLNRYLSATEPQTNLKTLPARVVVAGGVAIVLVLLSSAIAVAGLSLTDHLSK